VDRTDGVEPFERGGAYDSLPASLANYARLLAETGPEPEAR
jgi:hypothetical protein